jgi:hypothetical protein
VSLDGGVGSEGGEQGQSGGGGNVAGVSSGLGLLLMENQVHLSLMRLEK